MTIAVAALGGALASGAIGSRDDSVAQPPRPHVEAPTPSPTPAAAPLSPFAARLPGVVKQLDQTRRDARRQLARRAGRHAQAHAAKRLRDAYRRAASRLGTPSGRAATQLVATLRASAAGYDRLAQAARHGQARRYTRAARQVGRSERRLAAILGRRVE